MAPAGAHEGHLQVVRLVAAQGRGGVAPAPAPAREPGPATGPRSLRDERDVVSGNLTHVVYFVPRDASDERLDRSGAIERSVDSMLAWFEAQSGRRPVVDRRAGGALDVTFVRGFEPARAYVGAGHDGSTLGVVGDELLERGIAVPSKRYLVYAALPTGGVCGEGEYPLSPPGGAKGTFAAVYLDAAAACGARDLGDGTAAGVARAEVIAAQEWLHTEGLVPLIAPHECAAAIAHVCTGPLLLVDGLDPEEVDVMYPVVTGLTLAQKVLDRGHDDYFRHPLPTVDLDDSRWMR